MVTASPAVGVILMISITVVLVAVVASFGYGLIGGVIKTPNSAFDIEDARAGNYNITVVHGGGDTIDNAFTSGAAGWNNLMVKHNGVDIVWGGNVTAGGNGDADFASGEQLKISVTTALVSGDAISVVYLPTGDVMQRVKVT